VPLTITSGTRKHRFTVEIARTPQEQGYGLMNRAELGPDRGMIFPFDAPRDASFWMKNTLIPLDIIWLDEDWRIVSIAAAVPPCRADPCPTYPPAGPARYVVEVNAGFTRTHGIVRGDRVVVAGVRARTDRP